MNASIVARAGATPWPQSARARFSFSLQRRIGTSPPGPLRCGSTTCSVNAAATAASKALPPRSSIRIAVAVASQCVEAATPNVPRISGRVVKGGVLTMRGLLAASGASASAFGTSASE